MPEQHRPAEAAAEASPSRNIPEAPLRRTLTHIGTGPSGFTHLSNGSAPSIDVEVPIHLSCSVCHHYHRGSKIRLRLSRRSGFYNGIQCEKCGAKQLGLGQSKTRESLLSQFTISQRSRSLSLDREPTQALYCAYQPRTHIDHLICAAGTMGAVGQPSQQDRSGDRDQAGEEGPPHGHQDATVKENQAAANQTACTPEPETSSGHRDANGEHKSGEESANPNPPVQLEPNHPKRRGRVREAMKRTRQVILQKKVKFMTRLRNFRERRTVKDENNQADESVENRRGQDDRSQGESINRNIDELPHPPRPRSPSPPPPPEPVVNQVYVKPTPVEPGKEETRKDKARYNAIRQRKTTEAGVCDCPQSCPQSCHCGQPLSIGYMTNSGVITDGGSSPTESSHSSDHPTSPRDTQGAVADETKWAGAGLCSHIEYVTDPPETLSLTNDHTGRESASQSRPEPVNQHHLQNRTSQVNRAHSCDSAGTTMVETSSGYGDSQSSLAVHARNSNPSLLGSSATPLQPPGNQPALVSTNGSLEGTSMSAQSAVGLVQTPTPGSSPAVGALETSLTQGSGPGALATVLSRNEDSEGETTPMAELAGNQSSSGITTYPLSHQTVASGVAAEGTASFRPSDNPVSNLEALGTLIAQNGGSGHTTPRAAHAAGTQQLSVEQSEETALQHNDDEQDEQHE